MAPDDRWLAAAWPFVRGQLPPAPARVLEVGCGALGGFVPALLGAGYQAIGVDPEAPEGSDYRRTEFERYDPPWPVDRAAASLSLHHVADLDAALDRVKDLLVPGGALVVVEWARERFDEATANWCFARLAPPAPGLSRAGCTSTGSGGRPPGGLGTAIFGTGRPPRTRTPASGSWGGWRRGSSSCRCGGILTPDQVIKWLLE